MNRPHYPFQERRGLTEYARLAMTIVQTMGVLAILLASGIIALLFYERTVPTELLMLESAIVAALGTTLTSPFRPDTAALPTHAAATGAGGETLELTTGGGGPAGAPEAE